MTTPLPTFPALHKRFKDIKEMPAASKLSHKTVAYVATAGVGFGIFVFFLRRWLRSTPAVRVAHTLNRTSEPLEDGFIPPKMDRTESGRVSSRMRCTPSISERGSTRQLSMRQRNQPSVCVPPTDADILCGVENVQELIRTMERACSGLELVKNRSDKDKTRVEMLHSVVDRLKVLETDLSRLSTDFGYPEAFKEDALPSSWGSYQTPRAGTLSVLSDDSFMSALEDFPIQLDDEGREFLELDQEQMVFYQEGLAAACRNEVQYRKSRADVCLCESETDFAAKLWCLRQAFDLALQDDHRRLWLANSGRTLLGDILKQSKQDPSSFYQAFDDLMEFFNDENNVAGMEEELKQRGVVEFGFWDIVLDFILLDSFDDLKNPPSAIYSVTRNIFLSQSVKYSTLSTVVWSMLAAKRQRLKNPNGFIAHFYKISETVMPAVALGFLGTDVTIGDLCQYFKEQVTQLVLEVFSEKRVRYTSLEELSEDVWVVMQNKAELIQSRLSTELLPA